MGTSQRLAASAAFVIALAVVGPVPTASAVAPAADCNETAVLVKIFSGWLGPSFNMAAARKDYLAARAALKDPRARAALKKTVALAKAGKTDAANAAMEKVWDRVLSGAC